MTKGLALDPALEEFVQDMISRGQFASESDVVREGLRLLQEREQLRHAGLEKLRQAWREGIESGGYKPAEEVFDRLEAKYATGVKGEGA